MRNLFLRTSALVLGILCIPTFCFHIYTGWPLDQIELSMVGGQAFFGYLFIMYGLGKFPKVVPGPASDATRIRQLEAKVAYLMEEVGRERYDAGDVRSDRATTLAGGSRPTSPAGTRSDRT